MNAYDLVALGLLLFALVALALELKNWCRQPRTSLAPVPGTEVNENDLIFTHAAVVQWLSAEVLKGLGLQQNDTSIPKICQVERTNYTTYGGLPAIKLTCHCGWKRFALARPTDRLEELTREHLSSGVVVKADDAPDTLAATVPQVLKTQRPDLVRRIEFCTHEDRIRIGNMSGAYYEVCRVCGRLLDQRSVPPVCHEVHRDGVTRPSAHVHPPVRSRVPEPPARSSSTEAWRELLDQRGTKVDEWKEWRG